jgi:hypothetical protein
VDGAAVEPPDDGAMDRSVRFAADIDRVELEDDSSGARADAVSAMSPESCCPRAGSLDGSDRPSSPSRPRDASPLRSASPIDRSNACDTVSRGQTQRVHRRPASQRAVVQPAYRPVTLFPKNVNRELRVMKSRAMAAAHGEHGWSQA